MNVAAGRVSPAIGDAGTVPTPANRYALETMFAKCGGLATHARTTSRAVGVATT